MLCYFHDITRTCSKLYHKTINNIRPTDIEPLILRMLCARHVLQQWKIAVVSSMSLSASLSTTRGILVWNYCRNVVHMECVLLYILLEIKLLLLLLAAYSGSHQVNITAPHCWSFCENTIAKRIDNSSEKAPGYMYGDLVTTNPGKNSLIW